MLISYCGHISPYSYWADIITLTNYSQFPYLIHFLKNKAWVSELRSDLKSRCYCQCFFMVFNCTVPSHLRKWEVIFMYIELWSRFTFSTSQQFRDCILWLLRLFERTAACKLVFCSNGDSTRLGWPLVRHRRWSIWAQEAYVEPSITGLFSLCIVRFPLSNPSFPIWS